MALKLKNIIYGAATQKVLIQLIPITHDFVSLDIKISPGLRLNNTLDKGGTNSIENLPMQQTGVSKQL